MEFGLYGAGRFRRWTTSERSVNPWASRVKPPSAIGSNLPPPAKSNHPSMERTPCVNQSETPAASWQGRSWPPVNFGLSKDRRKIFSLSKNVRQIMQNLCLKTPILTTKNWAKSEILNTHKRLCWTESNFQLSVVYGKIATCSNAHLLFLTLDATEAHAQYLDMSYCAAKVTRMVYMMTRTTTPRPRVTCRERVEQVWNYNFWKASFLGLRVCSQLIAKWKIGTVDVVIAKFLPQMYPKTVFVRPAVFVVANNKPLRPAPAPASSVKFQGTKAWYKSSAIHQDKCSNTFTTENHIRGKEKDYSWLAMLSSHQKCSVTLKMHPINFCPKLRPGSRWKSFKKLPTPTPYSAGKGYTQYPLPIVWPTPFSAFGPPYSRRIDAID